jgi:hypothetical protein
MHGGTLLLVVGMGLGVGYGLDLVHQGRHVERLRDSRVTMGDTLAQELINHLYTQRKKGRKQIQPNHKNSMVHFLIIKIQIKVAHLIFQHLTTTMMLEHGGGGGGGGKKAMF